MNEQPNESPSEQRFETSASERVGLRAMFHRLVAVVETKLEYFFVTKAPFSLPENGKELIVKITPYYILVISVFSLLAFLSLVHLLSAPASLIGGEISGPEGIGFLFSILVLSLEVVAISGLFKRTQASWRLLFLATNVSLLGGILCLHPVGAILGAVISWYILFQTKVLYKN